MAHHLNYSRASKMIINRGYFRLWLVLLVLMLTILSACAQTVRKTTGREFVQKERKVSPSASPTKVIMGYYPAWKRADFPYTLIDFKTLTHLAEAFTRPDNEGNLIVDENYLYPELIAAAHNNGVKVIMSIGGWGNCDGFPPTVASVEKRTRFITQVVSFCKQNGYDGVDLDWEYVSNEEQRENFSSLVKELSAALKAQDPPLLLTIAAPAGSYWGRWINFEELHPYFDYISFMTYDFHGPWTDHSGHNSPLYTCHNDPCGSVDESYTYALIRQIPTSKLLLGIPFYGRSFNTDGLYKKATKSDYYNYSEIKKLLASGWKYYWDFCSQVPYLLNPERNTLISFDDLRSVFRKCQYVVEKGAAGVIIWEITADRYNGRSELLETVSRSFQIFPKKKP
ncbi:MAG: glycoside hydrolase family 18 protein [Candidatus Saccharicenans sp.]